MHRVSENERVSDLPLSQQQIQNGPFSDEILQDIFSFLPQNKLVNMSLVSKQWKNVSRHVLWEKKVQSSLRQTTLTCLGQLVGEEKMSWQDVTPSFLRFLDYHFNWSWSNKFVQHPSSPNNPLHDEFDFDLICPSITFGPVHFYIIDSTDILVESEGNVCTLESKNRCALTHLAVDGNFVFGLYLNGEIEQWNYKTREHICVMNTCYSEERKEFEELREEISGDESQTLASRQGFFAKEGRLFLFYVNSFVEVIEYQKSQHQLLSLGSESTDACGICVQGQLFCFSNADDKDLKLEIFNLSSQALEQAYLISIDEPYLSAVSNDENFIYAAFSNRLIVFDVKSKRENPIVFYSSLAKGRKIESIAVLGNILVYYTRAWNQKDSIYIMDRRDHKIIESMEVESVEDGHELSPTIIKRIINLSKDSMNHAS